MKKIIIHLSPNQALFFYMFKLSISDLGQLHIHMHMFNLHDLFLEYRSVRHKLER